MNIKQLHLTKALLAAVRYCQAMNCRECLVHDVYPHCSITDVDPVDVRVRVTRAFVSHVLELCDNNCRDCDFINTGGCLFNTTYYPFQWFVDDKYANTLAEFCVTALCVDCPFNTPNGCFFMRFNPCEYSFSSIDTTLMEVFN